MPTTITKGSNCITLIELLTINPTNSETVIEHIQRTARDVMMRRTGFVSLNLHRSQDHHYLCNYVQWENAASLDQALHHRDFVHHYQRYQGLLDEVDSDLYDVIYTDDRTSQGMTTIRDDFDGGTFINFMTTTPEKQPKLVEFVIGNDAQTFSGAPGYRAANFHRSHNGLHVINYSQWNRPQDFLDAINNMFHVPNLTMEQANHLASQGAQGVGATNFRFYDVVYRLHA